MGRTRMARITLIPWKSYGTYKTDTPKQQHDDQKTAGVIFGRPAIIDDRKKLKPFGIKFSKINEK